VDFRNTVVIMTNIGSEHLLTGGTRWALSG